MEDREAFVPMTDGKGIQVPSPVGMELITAQIARLELKPTDVLIVRCVGVPPLSSHTADRIRRTLLEVLGPDRKVLVCDDSMEFSILGQVAAQ